MKIAVVMYDKINLVNFANLMVFLHSFANANVKTCAFKPEIVDELGIRLHPEIYGESIYGADMVIVPDGIGALSLRYDDIFLSWIKSASYTKLKFGFDLGSLILAGAGFLDGKEACIRGGYKNALSQYCDVSDEKICHSKDVLSACEWNEELKTVLTKIIL
ncbi:MAG: hypothetical protein K5978_06990 [Campylobacter sp.]|nr:hypothetical protein [Campylobacter sp.]